MKYIHEVFLRSCGFKKIDHCDRYPSIGITFQNVNEDMNQIYWFYEMEHFIINIHDFYIKKDTFYHFPKNICSGSHMNISLIKTASMEVFNPYFYVTKKHRIRNL